MKTFAIITIAAVSLLTVMLISNPQSTEETQFQDFLDTHRVGYGTTGEYNFRLSVFADNLKTIERLNMENPQATFGVNEFADQTSEEMQKRMGLIIPAHRNVNSVHVPSKGGESVNWTSMWGSVKNQGQCGSCWAFSAAAAFEARIALANGSKTADLSFSEQELVDCVKTSAGCNGGFMDNAFDYLKSKGFCQEKEYKYTARDETCKDSKCSAGPSDKAIIDISAGNESDLLAELNNGPVAVAVDANSWNFYKGGIMSRCGTSLDHGVTLVASNFEEGSVTIRNSWGSRWGEDGHIRLAMNKNTCGYANVASVPTF